MAVHNSLVIYITLFGRLLLDIADSYPGSEPERDEAEMRHRTDTEGIQFLTETLPRLGKAFDKALQGDTPFVFEGFERNPQTGLPKFLGWLFECVFDATGMLLDSRDVGHTGAVKHVRQLLGYLYKLQLPNEEDKNRKVLDTFLQTEEELKNLSFDSELLVMLYARSFCSRVLAGSDPLEITPRHGPGAVATGEVGGEKSRFTRIYDTLEQVYPFTEYFMFSNTHIADDPPHLREDLESLGSGTAKVVLVPKDSRGPRLISCEPLELQWIQQGQQRKLYDILENHPLTRGRLNFTDQSVNQSFALLGSKTTNWVTLDMKDASDRVSVQLVHALLRDTPWFSALMASRSTHTRLPDGTVVKLHKFAPMGSAVCFPIEALCFFALAVGVLRVTYGMSYREAASQLYVYGDDIICRREVYPSIMQFFPKVGLMFNQSKCCVAGHFRESCGCDAYRGAVVTPVRLRATWGHRNIRSPSELLSYVSHSNEMYERGYYRVAACILGIVEDRYGILPFLPYKVTILKVSQTVSISLPGQVIGWYRPGVNPLPVNQARGIRVRMCKDYHRSMIYGYTVLPVFKDWPERGWESLLRTVMCGSKRGLPPSTYAVAHRSRLKSKWGYSQV